MTTLPVDTEALRNPVAPEVLVATQAEMGTVTVLHPDLVELKEAAEDPAEAKRADIEERMRVIAARFEVAIADEPEAETPVSAASMKLTFAEENAEDFKTDTGWAPGKVLSYASTDPFREANPGLAQAGTELIAGVVELASEIGHTDDPTLAYLDARRNHGGKRATVITQGLMDIDPGIADWISHLPGSERLRPVARPSKDGTTLIFENDAFTEVPKTKALSALVGGSGDGRAVIEREAWEAQTGIEDLNPDDLDGNTLQLISLGSGTGEPAMDTGITMMKEHFGEDFKVVVDGFDIDYNALMVAGKMAELKSEETGADVEFAGHLENLLSVEGIHTAVAKTGPEGKKRRIQSIGLGEYVPSDHATDSQEVTLRERMKSQGLISAEEFYGAVYASMPQGSVYKSGNMRDDSPEAPFVIDGLGWKGIIQRSTEDFMKIIERAGIPSEAVTLYVPKAGESAGVYNLIKIEKL